MPGGWLADRFGARLTLTRIVLAWSLFTMLTGLATGFVSLVVFRFLFGAGEAGAYPSMARAQSRWLPIVERARAGGLLWLVARWGAAFAPLIYGTLMRGIESLQSAAANTEQLRWFSDPASWRLAFIVSGAVGISWCLVFYPWFRDEPRDKDGVTPEERQLIEGGRGEMQTDGHMDSAVWTKLLTSLSLCAMAAYYIFGNFGWSFFVSWMPRYMKEVQGVPFEQSEWSSAWPLVCGGLACLAGGLFSDTVVRRTGWRRWGRAICPLSGCLVAAIAMLAIPHARSAPSATAMMCIASAAYDFGQAANWASIVDIGGRYVGIAMGLVNMLGNVGNSIQPYIGARVFHSFGWTALFSAYAIAFLLAMTMWLVIDPTRTFYDKSRPANGDLTASPDQ
jgi:MFS family permease